MILIRKDATPYVSVEAAAPTCRCDNCKALVRHLRDHRCAACSGGPIRELSTREQADAILRLFLQGDPIEHIDTDPRIFP